MSYDGMEDRIRERDRKVLLLILSYTKADIQGRNTWGINKGKLHDVMWSNVLASIKILFVAFRPSEDIKYSDGKKQSAVIKSE